MNHSQLATAQQRPELQSDLIDQVCDRFEAAVREGRRPRIEDFLEQSPSLDRRALLQELIALEVELLRASDHSVTLDTEHPRASFATYYQRFPEATSVLNDLQQAWDLQAADTPALDCPTHGLESEGETVESPASGSRRRINQFELQSILGEGGFGIVWRARDKRLQRDVALKVPRPDRLALSDRALFLREARAAAKLHHPQIVAIHEVGEYESEIYIVSELVDGVSLKTWLETRQMSLADTAQLIAKLATAVHHAHEQGIVHRDLKPANVLLDKKGEPHVADFGLAKRDTGEDSLSVAGQLMGTPAYMAPEQARGDHGAIDARTDVYALGAICYELLTGVRPFRGELSILLEQVQHSPPRAPRQIKPEIPKELESICLKCLEKNPAQRYVSAAALAEDLSLYQGGETLRGIPAALPIRLGKWLRRHRFWVSAIALTFVLALTIAGGLAWQFRGTKPIPVDLREVAFTTNPTGCEITIVALDPKTGEPDPTRIQHAKGRTPLRMNLPPNDYLVVAVLDELRFHEVYRHVPTRDELAAFHNKHLRWKVESSGVLNVPEIEIPRPDVTVGMGLIESSGRLIEPRKVGSKSTQAWLVPAFYADSREMSVEDIQKWGVERLGEAGWQAYQRDHKRVPGLGSGTHAQLTFPESLVQLEKRGKRLPSAAELYYLSTVVCPSPSNPVQDVDATAPCHLPDQRQMEGVHAGAWEWTSSRSAGPFSGVSMPPNSFPSEPKLRVVGGGQILEDSHTGRVSFKMVHERSQNQIGVRGFRSAQPRRHPNDFLRPADAVTDKL